MPGFELFHTPDMISTDSLMMKARCNDASRCGFGEWPTTWETISVSPTEERRLLEYPSSEIETTVLRYMDDGDRRKFVEAGYELNIRLATREEQRRGKHRLSPWNRFALEILGPDGTPVKTLQGYELTVSFENEDALGNIALLISRDGSVAEMQVFRGYEWVGVWRFELQEKKEQREWTEVATEQFIEFNKRAKELWFWDISNRFYYNPRGNRIMIPTWNGRVNDVRLQSLRHREGDEVEAIPLDTLYGDTGEPEIALRLIIRDEDTGMFQPVEVRAWIVNGGVNVRARYAQESFENRTDALRYSSEDMTAFALYWSGWTSTTRRR